MKIIAPVFIVGVVLLDLLGIVPKSSVGGPMTLFALFLLAMLAVGIDEAKSYKRGAGGYVGSVALSFVGGFAAVTLSGLAMDEIIPLLNLDGPLAASRHPMRYALPAAMMAITLLGSWLVLRLVGRLR